MLSTEKRKHADGAFHSRTIANRIAAENKTRINFLSVFRVSIISFYDAAIMLLVPERPA